MRRPTLAQGRLGPAGLWIFAVVASSPMTVQVGGIPTTYAATGVVGAPLAFLVVSAVLLILAFTYAGASTHTRHAAPLYALLARGLHPVFGVAAGAVALAGYLAIGTSLYGLAGFTLAGLGMGGSWWMWAAGIWLLVAVMGLLGGLTSARVLGVLLAVEIAVICCYIITAIVHRQGPITAEPFTPSALMVPGMAGVIAFTMAAFVGVETVPAYAEEARGGGKAVRNAMLAAVAFTGVFYAIGAWAPAVHFGTGQVAAAAADPNRGPLQTLGAVFGSGVTLLATVLLVTSIIAAMTSFHATASRYLFAMAREGVLPRGLRKVSKAGDGGTPIAASLLHTLLTGIVIGGFVLTGADPMAVMFTWLSTLGAVALLSLLVFAAVAAYMFFAKARGTGADTVLVRRIAPVTGAVLGTLLMVMMLGNLSSLLGVADGSDRWMLVPVIVAAVALIGLVWGLVIRLLDSDRSDRIGTVHADPVLSPVVRLRQKVM